VRDYGAVTGVPRPTPCFLDEMEDFGVRQGQKVWRSPDGERYFTWDWTHGEAEVFNRRGQHMGAADGKTGEMIKPARKGRRIDL
jgi:hypothetical protein